MSDTWELWETCVHVRGEGHLGHIVSGGRAGKVEWCQGGKQVVLQERWFDYGDEAEKLWEEAT